MRFRTVLSDFGQGKLVLLSTHIVSDIESIATKIAVMQHGQLVTCAAPETLLRRPAAPCGKRWSHPATMRRRKGRLKVTRAVRQADGVQARIVAREQPFPAAPPSSPTSRTPSCT